VDARRRDLLSRIQQLEGERAVQAQTAAARLAATRQQVKVTRRSNQEAKAVIAAAKRGAPMPEPGQSMSVSRAPTSTMSMQAVEARRVEAALVAARQRLDRLASEEQEHLGKLERERERLACVQLDSEPVVSEDSAQAQKIRALETRLDKSMIKYNEALAIRRTYDLIARRLRDERVGFDNQLAAIEKTLKSKDYDYQELLKMSHAANFAKERAKRELQQFKLRFDAERHSKDRELQERKQFVRSKIEQTQRLERKERQARHAEEEEMRRQQSLEAGSPGADGAHTGPALFGRGIDGAEDLNDTDLEDLARLQDAFERIQRCVGPMDVGQMLRRFHADGDTLTQLQQLVMESQTRAEQLTNESSEWERRAHDVRFSSGGAGGATGGAGGALGSRRLTQEFSIHLQDATRQTQLARQNCERVAAVLVDVRAGVSHLADKVRHYRSDITAPAAVTDDTVLSAFKIVEQKLLALQSEVGAVADPRLTDAAVLDSTSRSGVAASARSATGFGAGKSTSLVGTATTADSAPLQPPEVSLAPYNARVRTTSATSAGGLAGHSSSYAHQHQGYNDRSATSTAATYGGVSGAVGRRAADGAAADSGDDAASAFQDDYADDGHDDDAVLRRDQVKKISANAVLREAKKQRRKKGPSTAFARLL
jgi:hypothetical protein